MKPEFNIRALKDDVKYLNQIYDFVENEIPNLFRIWPLLGDYTINNRWDPKIDADLEAIGTGHYTILKSLNYIYHNKDKVGLNDPKLIYKNIYFHYGLIIDCINQIAFHILRFQIKLGTRKPFIKKMGIIKLVLKTIKWYFNNYLKGFNRIEKQGGFILYKIQPSRDYINILVENKSYKKFASLVRPVRNVFIHNPSIDIFKYTPEQDIRVVKLKKLTKNKFLNTIDKLNPNDLEHPTNQMNDIFDKAINMINFLWLDIYKNIENINSNDKFETLKNK